MRSSFTISDLEKLQKAGKIKGFVDKTEKRTDRHKCPSVKKPASRKGQKTKDWIGKNLWAWCNGHKLEMLTEHQFHGERKWRFDWAIPSLKIGIEYEGLMSEKSRHTTITGFTGDSEKYNAAQSLGWRVLRYTALNYKTLLRDLEKLTR